MSDKIVPNYEEMEELTRIFETYNVDTLNVSESKFSDMITEVFQECLAISFKDIESSEMRVQDSSTFIGGDTILLPDEEQLELKL